MSHRLRSPEGSDKIIVLGKAPVADISTMTNNVAHNERITMQKVYHKGSLCGESTIDLNVLSSFYLSFLSVSSFTYHRSRFPQLSSSQDHSNTAFTQKLNCKNAFLSMAAEFLYELLQLQNSVDHPNERCGICLEEYGTLSRETGTIEIEIRLPCSHTIGSACVVTWLKTNNTCPICRHEFFPAQPRPYLEHGIIDDEDDDEQEVQSDLSNTRELNDDYCAHLELDVAISMISELISQRLIESQYWSEGHTSWCIVAVSIYIASHLTGEPRSPREIATITGVETDHIRRTYDSIYPEREHLADEHLLSQLEEHFFEMAPLKWPAPGDEITDEQIEHNHILQMLRDGCQECCNELGLNAEHVSFSTRIAESVFAAGFMVALSPRSTVAVSILMASHMVSRPFTPCRIAEAICTPEDEVLSAYGLIHGSRYRFVQDSWPEEIDRGNMQSVVERLPCPSAFA